MPVTLLGRAQESAAKALPDAVEPFPVHGARHLSRATAGRAGDSSDGMPSSSVPYSSPLALHVTTAQIGYIGVGVTAAAGTRVQLSERLHGTEVPIQAVTVPASGEAAIPRALMWLCAPRIRTVIASASAPAAGQAQATVRTPSCAGRFNDRVAVRARVGRGFVVQVRDRWGIGDSAFRLCLTPPGGRPACTRERLRAGQRRAEVPVTLPRPGGWAISIGTGYGVHGSRLVWAGHPREPIRILAAGDSEMQILDTFLSQQLRARGAAVSSDARISTGLTSSFLFNWQSEAHRQAASLRPDVTVIFMGANDGFTVRGPGGVPVACCGPPWSGGYADLVASMMRTLLRGNAGRVYWFVLPAPRPANFRSVFDGVNAGIRTAARRFPGRVALIDANAFFTPGNRYRDYMLYRHRGLTIHEPDGIHLSTASDTIAASLLVHRLVTDHVIR